MSTNSEIGHDDRDAAQVGIWENEGGAAGQPLHAQRRAMSSKVEVRESGDQPMPKQATEKRFATDIRTTISAYLGMRSGQRPISIFYAIQNLRKKFPELVAANHDLTNLIAGEAISMRLNVHFDGRGSDPAATTEA